MLFSNRHFYFRVVSLVGATRTVGIAVSLECSQFPEKLSPCDGGKRRRGAEVAVGSLTRDVVADMHLVEKN